MLLHWLQVQATKSVRAYLLLPIPGDIETGAGLIGSTRRRSSQLTRKGWFVFSTASYKDMDVMLPHPLTGAIQKHACCRFLL